MNIKLTTEQLNRPDITEYGKLKKIPVRLVLENIRSRNNIGSVFRSADAFLIEEIILCGYTAQPPHRDIQKTALGATETVKWRYFKDTTSAIEALKNDGFSVWAIEQTSKSIFLQDFDFSGESPIALVLGNEVHGIESTTLDQCNGSIEIAQFGTKHSLNVAVCAGIFLHFANHQLLTTSSE